MPKVLIADNVGDICDQLLEQERISVDRKTGLSSEEIIEIIPDYNGIIVRSATEIKDRRIFEAAKNLKIIGRAGSGTDNIDIDLANEYGIMVVNTPTSNSISVAELAFFDMGAILRNLVYADRTTKNGEWEKKKLGKEGREAYGSIVGIIGLGNIGREFAKRAVTFGMNVIYTDPFVNVEGYRKVTLDELATQADVVSVHVPKKESTKGMITRDFLTSLKQNAIFINTARDAVIEPGALVQVLKERPDIRVGNDVYEADEPRNWPLAQYGDRALLTPHIGGSTVQASERGAKQVAEQLITFFQSGTAKHIVNFAAIPEDLTPFLGLTDRLALLGANLIGTQPSTIEISCYGNLNQHSELLSIAAKKGVLQFNTDKYVSYINASSLAQEYGIITNMRRPDEAKGYGDAVTVDLVTNGKRTSIRGNLDYDGKPVISRVDNFLIDFKPENSKSVFIYKDAPGIIGVIGITCGDKGVNIDDITTRKYRVVSQKTKTGRYNEEDAAMTVVNPALDQTIIDKITQELFHKKVNMYVATNVNF